MGGRTAPGPPAEPHRRGTVPCSGRPGRCKPLALCEEPCLLPGTTVAVRLGRFWDWTGVHLEDTVSHHQQTSYGERTADSPEQTSNPRNDLAWRPACSRGGGGGTGAEVEGRVEAGHGRHLSLPSAVTPGCSPPFSRVCVPGKRTGGVRSTRTDVGWTVPPAAHRRGPARGVDCTARYPADRAASRCGS